MTTQGAPFYVRRAGNDELRVEDTGWVAPERMAVLGSLLLLLSGKSRWQRLKLAWGKARDE